MKQVIPFRMGDVVKEIAPGEFGWSSEPGYFEECQKDWEKREKGRTHIIEEVMRRGTSFVYSTTHGAWFDHEQFRLIKKSNPTSLRKLQKLHDKEYGEEE